MNRYGFAALLAPFALAACKAEQPPAAHAAPAASTAPATCPPCPGVPDSVVAQIGSEKITLAELEKSAGRELHEVREKALEKLISERAIAPEAKKAGMTVEAFVRKRVEERVPNVSEAEAQKFFDENKARLGPQLEGKTFADVKQMIIEGLTGQKRQQMVGTVLEELKAKAGVKVLLEAPKAEVPAVGPSKGPDKARVTIVEFSDFQCPFCSRGKQVMDQVAKTYGDKVRIVFRDFPLSFHEQAQKAAEAGQCAHEQGKFWAMHDWMFDNQSKLAVDDLKGAAKKLGLDSAKFDACLTSGKHAGTVAESMKVGEANGVRGTPAFFVNGAFINGAQPFEKFKAQIDKELAK